MKLINNQGVSRVTTRHDIADLVEKGHSCAKSGWRQERQLPVDMAKIKS